MAEVFKNIAKSKGMTVVDEQFTTDKSTDFMSILTAIKAKNPDAIFFGGMDPQAGPMLRQMEQLGLTKQKYFGGDGICTNDLIKQSGGAKTLDNVVCAEGGASLDKMPGGKAWMKPVTTPSSPGQFQVYSPYVYDAVFVLVDAMKRCWQCRPQGLHPVHWAQTNFKGITTTVQFETNGELKNPAMTLYTYKGDKKIALN